LQLTTINILTQSYSQRPAIVICDPELSLNYFQNYDIGIVLSLYIVSCTSNNNTNSIINDSITKEWLSDSLGCDGLRKPIAEQLYREKSLLINKNFTSLQLFLGKSNRIYQKGGKTYHSYFISCALRPRINGVDDNYRKYSNEIECFIIITDVSNIVIDCNLHKP
jgi:hypothetical protein